MIKHLVIIAIALTLTGCSATGDTPDDKRAAINTMHDDVLAAIYAESARAKTDVEKSAGYAVFSNAQLNVFFIAAGTGYGVAKSNGRSTYMKMGEAGVGFGLGVKDFRALFVFRTPEAYKNFIDKGWAFGAEADAAAKSTNKGGQASSGVAIGDITVYQLTATGLALQATVKGTKYWKDKDLN